MLCRSLVYAVRYYLLTVLYALTQPTGVFYGTHPSLVFQGAKSFTENKNQLHKDSVPGGDDGVVVIYDLL